MEPSTVIKSLRIYPLIECPGVLEIYETFCHLLSLNENHDLFLLVTEIHYDLYTLVTLKLICVIKTKENKRKFYPVHIFTCGERDTSFLYLFSFIDY